MIPGWTHNIINLFDTEALVTVKWANEMFDKEHPVTFGGEKFVLEAGETLNMPKDIPHAVYGKEKFKMLLVVPF